MGAMAEFLEMKVKNSVKAEFFLFLVLRIDYNRKECADIKVVFASLG
jgi:hypothetical protein